MLNVCRKTRSDFPFITLLAKYCELWRAWPDSNVRKKAVKLLTNLSDMYPTIGDDIV